MKPTNHNYPFQVIDWTTITKTEHQGETGITSDELSSHRSITENGVKLLIIDGDFLENK